MNKMRNLIAVHCWKRKAGMHGRSAKAQRRIDKIDLQKSL